MAELLHLIPYYTQPQVYDRVDTHIYTRLTYCLPAVKFLYMYYTQHKTCTITHAHERTHAHIHAHIRTHTHAHIYGYRNRKQKKTVEMK